MLDAHALGTRRILYPKLRRRLLLEEAGALQGVPKKVVRAMQRAAEEHKLPARTVDASLGDAMSINVLASAVDERLDTLSLSSIQCTGRSLEISC